MNLPYRVHPGEENARGVVFNVSCDEPSSRF
jgi:hypothetical protein